MTKDAKPRIKGFGKYLKVLNIENVFKVKKKKLSITLKRSGESVI